MNPRNQSAMTFLKGVKEVQKLFDVIKDPKLEIGERNRRAKVCIETIAPMTMDIPLRFHPDFLTLHFNYNFDLVDENGATPLLLTIFKGHIDIFRMLLKAGANPNARHQVKGITPLTYAAEEGHIDIVRWLLEAKAGPCFPNNKTMLRPIDLATREGHLKITQWLVKAGESPEIPNLSTGERPLSLAIKNGHLDVARLLLEAHVDPDLLLIFGERLLSWAAEKGDIDAVQLLLEYHADPDLPNTGTGDTALICAAREGHREVVEILIDATATLELKNKNLKTALDVAIENQDQEPCIELDKAIANQKLPTVALLLSHGSFVRCPVRLINFLNACDQYHPELLVSLKELRKQSMGYLVKLENNRGILNDFLKNQLKQANNYLDKLKTLTEIHRGKLFDAVKEATIGSMINDVVKIVSEYDAPLQRLKFFKPAEIDGLLPKEEGKKQDSCVAAEPEVKPTARRSMCCRFM